MLHNKLKLEYKALEKKLKNPKKKKLKFQFLKRG